MSVVRSAARRRWSIVAGGVAVLCLLPTLIGRWPAAAAKLDAGTLRARILDSAERPYQGYVDSRGSIALPSVPQVSDVSTLFGGASSIRVWYASARVWRVAVFEPTGERDVYSTPTASYVWDFGRDMLTEITGNLTIRLPWAADVLPPDLARRLLGGAAATDRVEAIGSRRVAGAAVAGLRLTPGDADTTVGRVDIWADPGTGLPMQVEVTARGATNPVFTTRFLDLSQQPPDPAVVTPKRASSSSFNTTRAPDFAADAGPRMPGRVLFDLAGRPQVIQSLGVVAATYGSGFSRFVVVQLPGRLGSQFFNAARAAGGSQVPLAQGEGYSVRNALLSTLVVRTPGDRFARRTFLLAGMVGGDLLTRAGAELLAFAARPQ